MDESFWDLMRALPCSYCGAKANEECLTSSGKRSKILHSARFYAARRQLRGVTDE